MAHANALEPERLGDDRVVGALRRDVPSLTEVGDPREATALFVHGPADLYRAAQLDAGATDRFGGESRGRQPRLHVRRAASINPTVAHEPSEGIDRPPVPGRHHVEMAVQVQARPGPDPLQPSDHVDARMCAGMLGAALRFHVLNGHAPRAQTLTNALGAHAVVLAGWIHGGDANQLRREVHELVARALDFGEHAIDGIGARHQACARGEKAAAGRASSYAPTRTAKDPSSPIAGSAHPPDIARTYHEEASWTHA